MEIVQKEEKVLVHLNSNIAVEWQGLNPSPTPRGYSCFKL